MDAARPDVYALNRWQAAALILGAATLGSWAVSAADGARLGFALVFAALLLGLSVIDARWFVLPDGLNAALAAAGALATWALTPGALLLHLAAGAGAYAALVAVEKAFKALRGHDGLGRGDAKLFGALGLWIGPFDLPIALLAASSAGLVAALAVVAVKRDARAPIPFGPFLALGGWTAWLHGPFF